MTAFQPSSAQGLRAPLDQAVNHGTLCLLALDVFWYSHFRRNDIGRTGHLWVVF